MKKLVFVVVLAAGIAAGFAVGRKCAGDACEACGNQLDPVGSATNVASYFPNQETKGETK